MPIEFFVTLKIIHIGSLIFWLGPSLGAWFCLLSLRKYGGEFSSSTQKIYQVFIKMLIVEHIAFITLLISGFGMAFFWFGFHQAWIQWKLLIILLFIVPLEIIDIWYGNIKMARIFSSPERKYYTSDETQTLVVYHRYVTGAAIIIIPIAVLSIFWLVIAKPNF
ncbi:MAG: DUF2269 family protein [Cellvibrio sp.]|nr:DUF2269 family protein [Cellvibrio sp.]